MGCRARVVCRTAEQAEIPLFTVHLATHSDTNWAMRRTTTFLLGAAAAVAFAAAVISSRTGE